jgi:hypothetical protein
MAQKKIARTKGSTKPAAANAPKSAADAIAAESSVDEGEPTQVLERFRAAGVNDETTAFLFANAGARFLQLAEGCVPGR